MVNRCNALKGSHSPEIGILCIHAQIIIIMIEQETFHNFLLLMCKAGLLCQIAVDLPLQLSRVGIPQLADVLVRLTPHLSHPGSDVKPKGQAEPENLRAEIPVRRRAGLLFGKVCRSSPPSAECSQSAKVQEQEKVTLKLSEALMNQGFVEGVLPSRHHFTRVPENAEKSVTRK